MTCIVGLVDENDTVWMGGDSLCAMGWDVSTHSRPKVQQVGPVLIGMAGDVRASTLLRYHLDLPPLGAADGDIDRYVEVLLVEALRTCFQQGGFASKENDKEAVGGANFLVGLAGRIWRIGDNYGIDESADGFMAVGCGEAYALGALFATRASPHAELRVRIALAAAAQYSAFVRDPFTVISLPAAGK